MGDTESRSWDMSSVCEALYSCCKGDKEAFQSPDLKPYAKLSHEFTTLDSVVMLQNRVVIPSTLRADVLKFLHSGHAGAHTMQSRV